HLRTLQSITVQ
nr:immunoglobulin heavy chain junction region [Mus musculus]